MNLMLFFSLTQTYVPLKNQHNFAIMPANVERDEEEKKRKKRKRQADIKSSNNCINLTTTNHFRCKAKKVKNEDNKTNSSSAIFEF